MGEEYYQVKEYEKTLVYVMTEALYVHIHVATLYIHVHVAMY